MSTVAVILARATRSVWTDTLYQQRSTSKFDRQFRRVSRSATASFYDVLGSFSRGRLMSSSMVDLGDEDQRWEYSVSEKP